MLKKMYMHFIVSTLLCYNSHTAYCIYRSSCLTDNPILTCLCKSEQTHVRLPHLGWRIGYGGDLLQRSCTLPGPNPQSTLPSQNAASLPLFCLLCSALSFLPMMARDSNAAHTGLSVRAAYSRVVANMLYGTIVTQRMLCWQSAPVELHFQLLVNELG